MGKYPGSTSLPSTCSCSANLSCFPIQYRYHIQPQPQLRPTSRYQGSQSPSLASPLPIPLQVPPRPHTNTHHHQHQVPTQTLTQTQTQTAAQSQGRTERAECAGCTEIEIRTSLSIDNLIRTLDAQEQKVDRLLDHLSRLGPTSPSPGSTATAATTVAESIRRSFDDGLKRLQAFAGSYRSQTVSAPKPRLVEYAALKHLKLKPRTGGQASPSAIFLFEGCEDEDGEDGEEVDMQDTHDEGMKERGEYDGITYPTYIFDVERLKDSTLDTAMELGDIIDMDSYENENEHENEKEYNAIDRHISTSATMYELRDDIPSPLSSALAPGSPSLASQEHWSSPAGSPPPSPAWILSGGESPLSEPPKDLEPDTMNLDLELLVSPVGTATVTRKVHVSSSQAGSSSTSPTPISVPPAERVIHDNDHHDHHDVDEGPSASKKRKLRRQDSRPDYVNHPMDSEKKKSHTTTTRSIRSTRTSRNRPDWSGRIRPM